MSVRLCVVAQAHQRRPGEMQTAVCIDAPVFRQILYLPKCRQRWAVVQQMHSILRVFTKDIIMFKYLNCGGR